MTGQPPGPSRRRLGVVGCGRVFERLHLPAIRRSRHFRLAAVCDSDAPRRRWLTRALPETEVFESAQALLAESDLDALLVCTPPASHAQIVLEALRRGCHVLVEKPMATTVEDAREILEASRAGRRVVAVGFNRRFRRSYRALRESVATSTDGDVRVRFVFQAEASRWGGRRDGTVLWDVASHQLDLVPWILDQSITEVQAFEGGSLIGRSAVTIGLRLSGGAEAELEAGYGTDYIERLEVRCSRSALTAHPAVVIDPRRIGLTLIGVREMPAAVERRLARAMEVTSLLGRRLLGRPSLTLESVERQLADFATRLGAREERQPGDGADAEDGVRCATAVDACLRSLARDGAWQAPEGDRE